MILKKQNITFKRFLNISLVSIILVLPISPSTFAAAIESNSNECLNFYHSTVKLFNLPILKKVKFFETQSAYGSRLIVIDLAQVSPSSIVQKIVNSYFRYVSAIYQERLKKFEGDPSGAAAVKQANIDHSLAQRSVLVLDTSESFDPQAPSFNGGVRVTYARNPGEKLPLQYDFPDYKRYTTAGTAVEVGRLTAQTAVSPELTINLIQVATQVALQDPSVTDIYVHTSRSHSRLYRLMGLTPSSTDIKDDLNYVLRFTVQDAVNWLKHQQTR